MCYAAQSKLFDTVVIYDITRGSRDVGDWFSFRKPCCCLAYRLSPLKTNWGICLTRQISLPELLSIGIGQHHVLTTRQKSIDGITTRAKDCVFLGGRPPLGYDIVDQKYVINEQEAEWVRLIFNMYAAGDGYSKIIDALPKTARRKDGPPTREK